jgi:hypothetical protein
VTVGDAALRQELAAGVSTGQGGMLVSGAVIYVDTIADLQALDTSALVDGQQVQVKEYHAGTGVGGGEFYWDAASEDADNGGVVFEVDGVVIGRWKRRFNGNLTVQQFGATGNGVSDDAPAIQAAFDSGARTVIFPRGNYILDSSQASDSVISISSRVEIIGEFGSQLSYTQNIPNTHDILKYNPQTLADEGVFIEGLWVIDRDGSGGRNVFYSKLTSSTGIKKLRIHRCLFRSTGQRAIRIDNDDVDLNPNGLFLSTITESEINGGIYLRKLGDSCSITDNVITGPNQGIFVSHLQESDPSGSSACLEISRNNITSDLGAIFVTNGRQYLIQQNNIEQLVALPSGFCIEIHNSQTSGFSAIKDNKISPTDPTSECGGLRLSSSRRVIISGNLIGSAGISGGTTCLSVENSRNLNIDNNDFYISQDCTGLSLDVDSLDNIVGSNNNYDEPFTGSTQVVDNAVNTTGVVKFPTLQNSWVNKGTPFEDAYFVKFNGMVTLGGVVEGGNISADVVLFTLPFGFRPKERLNFLTSYRDIGGTHMSALIRIDQDGSVRLETINGSTTASNRLSFSGISFHAT